MTSSRTIGSVVRSRTIRHSSSVGQGCSKSTRSRPSSARAAIVASCRRQPPLASAMITSPSSVASRTALTRARVLARVGAELELEAGRALGLARPHVRDHLVDRAERDRDVEREVGAGHAAEQRADGELGRLAQEVPAGDVERRLRVRVAGQGAVHRLPDGGQVARIDPEQRRGQLCERGARAGGVRRQVGRAERARLAPPDQAAVGLDADDRARQRTDRPTAGHHVFAVRVAQVVAVDGDAGRSS